MKKYKVKATNNVITSYTDEKRVSNLSLEQMTEMKKNGMSFQNHTVNHPDLSQESSESQTAELKDSKTYLDTNLNQETIAVAYPSGRYSDHTVNHPDLSQESSESQTAELKDSKTYLDTNLNQETIAVAYPSGRYSDSTLKIAKSLNYKLGVTTNEGLSSASDGLLSLNRIRILPSTSANQLLQQMLVQ